MYTEFQYETLPLKDILLDDRNPRLVNQSKSLKQPEILAYLYEHEDLDDFVHKIAHDGRNPGAERPYVIKSGSNYVVIEGNTRIAAYKVLAGLLTPPNGFTAPHVPKTTSASLSRVDCSVAPNREAVMPIMANAHFGLGDKSKWKYLGSRKVIYDEWKDGKSLPKLAKVFGIKQGDVKDLILEYKLYQKALSLGWTKMEKQKLLDPAVAFNPPVRFLETGGHKQKMGISFDSTNLEVVFNGDADKKFKHLLKKLVIDPVKGLGATASYDAVFADYINGDKGSTTTSASGSGSGSSDGSGGSSSSSGNSSGKGGDAGRDKTGATKGTGRRKTNALFAYFPTMTNALIEQLMKEARDIDTKKLPASATFLLRNIVESVLKHIIDEQKANTKGSSLDLEGALNLCSSNFVSMQVNDKKILKQFHKEHLNYLNLGAHGNIIPNAERVAAARDCIDQFIKRHV